MLDVLEKIWTKLCSVISNGKVNVSNTAVLDVDSADIAAGIVSALPKGQAVAGSSVPVVLPAAQITTLTPPAAITGFAVESGGNLAAIKTNTDKNLYDANGNLKITQNTAISKNTDSINAVDSTFRISAYFGRGSATTAYSAGQYIAPAALGSFSGTTANASATISSISGADIVNFMVGQKITGTNIPTDTFITAVAESSITLSKTCTGSGTSSNINVYNSLSFDFSSLGSAVQNGNTLYLDEVIITSSKPDLISTVTLGLLLFNSVPTATGYIDYAAVDLARDEINKSVANIDNIVGGTAFTNSSMAKVIKIGKKMTLPAGSKTLLGYLFANSAFTPSASGVLTVIVNGRIL